MIDWKQETVEDIIESEHEMLLRADELYGDYYLNATGLNELLNNFIESFTRIENFAFLAFLSQVKKHHTLALFSALRQHHVQKGMLLRQVVEAYSWALYALGNANIELFVHQDKNQRLSVPEKLGRQKNQWIEKNFPDKSDEIVQTKKLINETVAHSNIVYSFQNFKAELDKNSFHTPFFDFTNTYKIKGDLWQLGNIAIGMLDAFHGANMRFNVYKEMGEFIPQLRELNEENRKLQAELIAEGKMRSSKKARK